MNAIPKSSMQAARGFSLMEMAVVLMILGTLMSGVLVAVSQTTENNRRSTAQAQLRQIEDALYGYAQTNGRLPCPASTTSAGLEVASGTGCNASWWYGFVPAATLGLYGSTNGDGLLLDPWQNPYRYAIAQYQYLSNYVFTSTANLDLFYNSGTALGTGGMLRVCTASTCNAAEIRSNQAIAVVLSMGADWATCTSTNEIENACETASGGYNLPADPDFVVTDYAEDLFDDQLVWLSPYLLFNRMISAGKLP